MSSVFIDDYEVYVGVNEYRNPKTGDIKVWRTPKCYKQKGQAKAQATRHKQSHFYPLQSGYNVWTGNKVTRTGRNGTTYQVDEVVWVWDKHIVIDGKRISNPDEAWQFPFHRQYVATPTGWREV